MWNHGGTSDNPCDEDYLGRAANSEPEVINVQKFLTKVKSDIKYYQSLHSYGQLIVLPWAYTDVKSPDYAKMKSFGNKVCNNSFGTIASGATFIDIKV